MAIEVGSAYVSIMPSFRSFGSALQEGIGNEGVKAGRQVGDDIGDGVHKGVKAGAERARDSMLTSFKGVGVTMLAAAGLTGGIEFFKGLIDDARESAKVASVTANVIKSTGGSAQITANQVGNLATAISNKTGADDEAVQSGQNLLLTFTNIQNRAGDNNDIFNQASQSLVDMTSAMNNGNVGSEQMKATAIQLGKALNDPVKGISALSRVGVTFTDQQKKQIEQMIKVGDTAGAQRIILAELGKEFGGSAAAASNPMQRLGVVFGNLKEQLGAYLLPLVDKFASFVSDRLIPAVSNFATNEGPAIGRVFGDVGSAIKDVVGFVTANADWLGPIAIGAGAAVAVIKGLTSAASMAKTAMDVWRNATALWQVVVGGAEITEGMFTTEIWANTAALLANPLTWVVLGLVAFGIALYEAYQHSQTFRDIVNGAFHAVADAGLWMWNVVLKPTWDALVAAFNWVVGGITAAWTGFLQPTFVAIGAAGQWLWSAVLKPTWDALVAAWNVLVGGIALAWNAVGAPLFHAIAAIAGWLWDTVLKVVFFAIKAEWALLVGALKLAWDYVGAPLFHAIAAIAGWLWDTVLKVVFFAIKTEWSILVGVLKWAWDNIGSPVFHAIATVAGWLWSTVLSPVFGAIKTAWGALLDGMKWAWDHVLKPVWDAIVAAAHVVGDTLGKAFDGLKDSFATAFKFAHDAVVTGWKAIADWVNKYVIDPINAVFHIGISPVPTFGGGGGTNPAGGKGHGREGFAAGGPVIGPGTSTSDSIPAMLSHGEFVMNAAAVQRIGVGTLSLLNRQGRLVNLGPGGDAGGAHFGLPGFAAGGSVDVDAIKAWIHQQAGKPYIMGATGPDAFDCSGLVGAVWALATGKDPFHRYFSTVNEGDGFFQPGMGGPNDFNVGYEGGAGGAGHTVGTFAGLNFEATPPRALVGTTNYTPTSGLFTGHGHLPLGQSTIWGWLYEHTVGEVKEALHAAMAGVADHVPALGMISDVLRSIVASAVDLLPFDDGGLLMPGQAGFNATNRPEPVFTGGQWDVLEGMAAGGGRGDTHINVYPQRADFGVRDLEALQARQDALSRVRRAH